MHDSLRVLWSKVKQVLSFLPERRRGGIILGAVNFLHHLLANVPFRDPRSILLQKIYTCINTSVGISSVLQSPPNKFLTQFFRTPMSFRIIIIVTLNFIRWVVTSIRLGRSDEWGFTSPDFRVYSPVMWCQNKLRLGMFQEDPRRVMPSIHWPQVTWPFSHAHGENNIFGTVIRRR